MDHKVAVITGAGSGIGRGIAVRLGADDYNVLVVDIDSEGASETLDLINADGGSGVAIRADVSVSHDVASFVKATLENWGRIDVLVNNAGVARVGSVVETSESDFDLTVAVNLKGVFLCSKHVLPTMIEAGQGVIVNVASVAALAPAAEMPAYSAAKAAVVNLTQQMARDYGPVGIRAVSICPGTVPTPIHRIFYTEEEAEAWLADAAARKPLRMVGTPEDIANAVRFLVSDEARYITGATLVIDGGSLVAGDLG